VYLRVWAKTLKSLCHTVNKKKMNAPSRSSEGSRVLPAITRTFYVNAYVLAGVTSSVVLWDILCGDKSKLF
jgi:hypothetical protein